MQLPGFRPLDRGEFSILAAFSLIVILAGAGLFLQTFTPTQVSQTAAAESSDKPSVDQTCLPGSVNEITINKGSFSSLVKDQSVDCYAGQSTADKQKNLPNTGYPQCEGIKHNECQVIACTPPQNAKVGHDECVIVGTCNTDDPNNPNDCKNMMSKVQTGKAADVFSVMKTNDGDLPGFTQLLKGDVNGGSEISAAFGTSLTQAQAQTQSQIDENGTTINGIQQFIDGCANGNTDPNCTSDNIAKWQAQQKNLADENAQLQSQMKDLGSAQQELAPGLNQGPCQNGQVMDPKNGCTTPTPQCTTVGCSGPTDVAKGTGSTFGNGTNALSSLLSGFARGLASSPPAAPASPAPTTPAPACSTDPNTYSQQQQQYQTALQQYNYQQQQYQYQQQQIYNYGGTLPQAPVAPQPCNPSTQQQCSLQPPTPDASSCTGGSWTPQMSGQCIVGWQCSNLGAQLSCQPQTADVGMSVAISYSCAQGIASGSGFSASGQSGTSTATVAAPPAGTNTATYALTCTQGQVTSGAQCSIQIASPSIILVANPATIHAGATSLIGWVTTGLQSCIISSPDDATFTSQNSANTSVNGTATTLPANATEHYLLHCTTVSGGTKDATVPVVAQ